MIEYPAETPFPTRYRDGLIEIYNTRRQWMIYAEGMAKNAMPKTFTDKMKWINCNVKFIIFLKSHPGSNGFPIHYVVCDDVNPIVRNNPNLWDYYDNRNQFQGRLFTHDASKFYSYIIRLIL